MIDGRFKCSEATLLCCLVPAFIYARNQSWLNSEQQRLSMHAFLANRTAIIATGRRYEEALVLKRPFTIVYDSKFKGTDEMVQSIL